MTIIPVASSQRAVRNIREDFHVVVVVVMFARDQNYNKSRIHSSRGARDVEIRLDGVLIFVGEIARAAGGVVGTSECFGDVRARGVSCTNAIEIYCCRQVFYRQRLRFLLPFFVSMLHLISGTNFLRHSDFLIRITHPPLSDLHKNMPV